MTAEKFTLCIDVGNTETQLGLFNEDVLENSWTLTTPNRSTADELYMQLLNLGLADIEDGAVSIIASVVPDLTDSWECALEQLPNMSRTFVVGPGLKNGLPVKMKNPAEVGADRIADCVAAKELYGSPVMVVDLGTTTNINIIGNDGALLGGLIAPGMRTSASAAFSAAAQLSAVTLTAPENVIGKTTREAIQSGIVLGEASRIGGLIGLIERELGYGCLIVLTGSDAAVMQPLLNYDTILDEDLTMQGLYLICQKNLKKK